MENCRYKDRYRIINGTVRNYDDKCVANATVILSALTYCSCCNENMIKRIGYTTTNEYGEYVFNIDILEYENVDFVLEVFNPLKKM